MTAVVLVLGAAVPARAAGEASDVVVEVVDAATNAPVPLARVALQGETAGFGYTDADGRARFESVATGAYRAGVFKRDYVAARSPFFDVQANRTSTVRVRLERSGALKHIGSVSVSTSPARASRDVGQDDALRHLDGSLHDAIGDLPGVTSSGGGFAIDGNDPSQTGTSIDGVSIPGAGGGLADRGINADLFGGASVSSGAANGALGGSVNFRTLQPTRFAQQQATLQYGSNDASSALVVARGSVNNLGYVLEHAVRGRTSPFTGLDLLDQSGLAYRHDADRTDAGDLAKLRWAPSLAQTLTLTASSTSGESGLVCAQSTALTPCGYGPGASLRSHGGLLTLSETATVGAVTVNVNAFANGSASDTNEPARALAGVAAPQSTAFTSTARGVGFNVQLPGGERHELSLSGQNYGLTFAGGTTTPLGTFTTAQSTSYHGLTLLDRYHPSARLTLTARAGSSASNGTSTFASGLDVRWQPTRTLAYDVTGSAGDAGAGLVVSSAFVPDPASLTYDCAHGIAYGDVPSVNAPHQRSSAVRASVEQSGRRGRLALTAWSARLQGAPVLSALDATPGLPPSYLGAVGAFASSPLVCGGPSIASVAFTSFQPADQTARGATLSGTLEFGKALLAAFVTVQSRFVTSGSPATSALTPPGMQVPDAPLHRAGVVGTVRLGKAVDALANVSYTSANNPNRLPAYTLFNAGFATPLREGSLALVGTNLANAHPGPFIAPSQAIAFARIGAAPLALAATPLAPRAVSLTYTVRVGRLGAAGSGAGTAEVNPNSSEGGTIIGNRFSEMSLGPHPNALQINPDNDLCTPVAARVAQPVLDAIGRIAAAAERAKKNGRYAATIAGGNANAGGVPLTYTPYDEAARFAIVVGGTSQSRDALLNCGRFSFARPDQREKFHAYLPPPSNDRRVPGVVYTPALGLYTVPAQGGGFLKTITPTLDEEPATPPADPFALRATCPASSKPIADAMVAAVKAARDAQRSGATPAPSDVAGVVARRSGPTSWLELAPRDPIAEIAIHQCLHVAAVPRPHLEAAGVADARRFEQLGFADRFGFYEIARPGDTTRPRGTPAPASSPSPSPRP
ncbi:MAG TPA: TonB-dependent receptor [Candidatus Elarobacter sp.]|nr:TonB-dependent receptor [Candidatus Elarobacter sp.]